MGSLHASSIYSLAIAIASCFMDENPILVVCPAILRFSWAEELERWLPFCSPTDIHLVFGHQNNLKYLTRSPKVVVISYTMLHRLRKSMLEQEWALMIVDECHNIRCTKKMMESEETQAVLDMAIKVKRIILLSGTPSLSRPYDIFHQINMLWSGLLGKDKYEFASNYCSIKLARSLQGKIFKDFSNGIRLEELNVLLKQTVMIRRLKENLLRQLPPKRRQVMRLMLKGPDIALATAACREGDMIFREGRFKRKSVMNNYTYKNDVDGDEELSDFHETNDANSFRGAARQLSFQELGIAKLSGFCEWLSNHFIVSQSEGARNLDLCSSQKMIIFAHHLKVLDRVQEFACEKGIEFIRIDGSTLPKDRQAAVLAFQSSAEVRLAIIGITVGGVGLDLTAAQNVVFLELPKSASEMLQAEDRAHRRGQTNAVNIYFFCAKDTLDESHWQYLNRSLCRISSMMNGQDDAIQEIKVDRICDLDLTQGFGRFGNSERTTAEGSEVETSGPDVDNHSREDGLLDTVSDTLSEAMPTAALNASVDCIMDAAERHNWTSKESDNILGEQIEADTVNLMQTDAIQLEVDKAYVPEMVDPAPTQTSENKGNEAVEVKILCSDYACEVDNGNDKNDSENITNKASSFFNAKLAISQKASVNLSGQTHKLCTVMTEEFECGSAMLNHSDTSSSIQPDSLRFEVSHYTGRIHLYACIPGKDSRPRPLFENFRPEELDSLISSATDMDNEISTKLIKKNPAYHSVFVTFVNEWNDLKPIERNKLLGKPLQLPLSLELYYLKESVNHEYGGLLKGGSKRRVTPLSDISNPLPPNAVWKKILLRRGAAKKEKEYSQAWTITDEPLCKLCQTPCMGKLAKEPEFFEDLFCDLSCFQEYRIRTSQRSLRMALFQIEHGICTQCRLDCHKLVECIKPLSASRRREIIEKQAPKVANKMNLLDKLVNEPIEGNAWHADHIVPVYKGGGECRLENMRTLCVACHYEVTAAQREERRSMKIKAKEQLKALMEALKYDGGVEQIETKLEERACLATGESADELLIRIPGSAYSSGENTISEAKPNGDSPDQERGRVLAYGTTFQGYH
ncbi:hypothetical protein MRB53_005725 [Persea americana]|uniref:Uncharacterized protein n=1 Tax=Persea americana TaxID=3435 RepID=A0ACC2MDV5_PERAE|nr:hypothetical protein MRB53_005725 [Persea americana]